MAAETLSPFYDVVIPKYFDLGKHNMLPDIVTHEKLQGFRGALRIDETEEIHRGERRFATDPQRVYIWLAERGLCGYCKTDVDPRPYCGMNADHIVPYSKGGLTLVENLVCACEKCNVARGSMDVLEFFKIIEGKDGLKERNKMYRWNSRNFFAREMLLKYGWEPDEETLRRNGYGL